MSMVQRQSSQRPLDAKRWGYFLFTLLVLCPSSAHAQCVETCANAECVQSSFNDCTVVCNNTGVATTVGTCLGATFTDSTVTCTDGACTSATLSDTVVTCTGENTCQGATIWNSTLTCHDGSNCASVHAYASVVTCLDYASCTDVYVTPCSCCGSDDNEYTCTQNGLVNCALDTLEFCATTYLGRTCLEWGNPACLGLTLPSSGTEVSVCTDGDCQSQVYDATSVLCEDRNAVDTCRGSNFTQTLVDCNAGACINAVFFNSTVQCFMSVAVDNADDTGGSCDGATARESTISCARRSDDTASSLASSAVCANVDFVTSAVECAYDACTDAAWRRCTCCDGPGCDGSYGGDAAAPSCASPIEFCSQVYLGRTCKEWGNPVCVNVAVDAATTPPLPLTICELGDCQQTVFTSEAVLCDNKDYGSTTTTTCDAIQATQSIVACEAGACRNGQMTDSTVTCTQTRGEASCTGATMTRSIVSCWDESCDSATLVASAVTCDDYVTCSGATLDDCTCCDGDGCLYASTTTAPSCLGDLSDFCAGCAGQGNPLCGASNGTVVASPPMVPVSPVPVPGSVPISVPAPVPVSVPVPIPISAFPPPVPIPISAISVPVPSQASPSPAIPVDSSGPQVPSNGAVYYTSSGMPLDIPPLAGANETMEVTVWPKHGSIALKDDKTITYSPFEGFSGTDSFDVEVCKEVQKCQTVRQNVTIQSASSSESSSFNGLYLLSLLVLLPIAAAIWYFKRARRVIDPKLEPELVYTTEPSSQPPSGIYAEQTHQQQQHLQRADGEDDHHSRANTVSHLTDETSSQPSDNKNGVYGQDSAQPRKSASSASDPPGSHGVQQAQALPPAAMALMRGDLPDNKDQCRSVSSGRTGLGTATTVIVTAVPVNVHDTETVEA